MAAESEPVKYKVHSVVHIVHTHRAREEARVLRRATVRIVDVSIVLMMWCDATGMGTTDKMVGKEKNLKKKSTQQKKTTKLVCTTQHTTYT